MISFQTNIDSLIAQQNLNINSKFQSSTIQQLTSGYRINSSGDDAAGLSVANQDRDQIAQITQGVANGNNGTAQLQIMDGGMSNISQILDRLQTLAAQSASSSFTGSRSDLNAEFQSDITELNRQAQAIGLNTGGTFAQTMDVYLGGGGGANAGAVSQNAQVTVDLSKSTVDAHSLGLAGMGMQVVAGTADISSNSSTHSAYDIVTNASNLTGLSNHTTFYLSGPGFSDGGKVALSVDLNGVSDTTTLVTAINNAINTAVANTSNTLSASAAAALKTAGIAASVNTDATGAQELAFSSNTTAFQVEAGDQMANALMGNLSTNPTTAAQGLPIATTVTGAATAAPGAFAYNGVTVQISGAGLASPQTITFTSAQNTMGTALSYLQTQVAQNAALKTAGITVTQATPSSALVFTSATGETFSVQATGDTANSLGLGSLDNTSAISSSPAFYSTITGGNYASLNTGNGLATLGFSLDGGTTDGGVPANTTQSVAHITGTAPSGINGSAQVNTTALGSTALTLTVNNQAVNINFANDANKSTTESLANVAKYINSQVNAAMGWGSDVKLATVAGVNASSTINLVDPYADSNSSLVVANTTTATALGLAPGTSTGTNPVGNTVTLNLAGGDATSAAASSTATAGAMTNGINTSAGGIVTFSVDGQTVAANFANDTNNVGTAAVYTGATLGASGAASTINLSALQAQAAALTGNALGAAATVNTSALEAQQAVYTGAGVAGDTFTGLVGGITINGHAVNISDAPTTLEEVRDDINNNTPALTGLVTASVVTNNGIKSLQLTSVAPGGTITIVKGGDADTVGLSVAGQSANSTATGAAAQALSVTIDNGSGPITRTITWTGGGDGASATESLANVVADINSKLDTAFTTPGVNYASVNAGTGAITIASPSKGASTVVTVLNNTAAQTLGLTTAGTVASRTANGAAAQTLSINIDGLGAKTIDFSTDANVGNAESLTQVAQFINAKLDAAGTGYTTPGVNYAAANTAGELVFTGVLTGFSDAASPGSVSVGNGAAAETLALTTVGSLNPTIVYGKDESVANVVSYLNQSAQKALGTATTAQIFTANGNTIGIASQTKGAKSTISLASDTSAASVISAGLGLSVGALGTAGQSQSLSSIASTLTQAFRGNTTLNEAGLQASASGNGLAIASSNNTSFRLAEYDTAGGTTLGFTANTGPFSAALNSGKSQATLLDAGGTSAIGTGTTASPYLSFKPMLFGSDTQSLTFTANNAAGVQQPLTITLRNDTGAEGASATSGASIDAAVGYINSQLQASKNPTLESIVAVKENVAGTEEINFLSSLSSFSVSVGSSINGNGVNGGAAQTFGSVANGAANNSAIDTLAGAQAAVTAVTAAVATLGSAQATVGKGENQLSYAVNLAQSQITNISAAQSQIRDANVAQEAANMTKAQVLQQATIAAMAQANQEPQAVLSLLKP
jgi:flagellin